MPSILPAVVTSAYEYETFTSVHTIYSDTLGIFGLTSLACVLSSYTISCRGSTNVTVRITGSTLTISGYYGDVFDQDEINYRGARRLPAVTSIYNYNDLPAYYWKATKFLPDRRQTTSISINIITNNGAINTTQIIKNNWDYKRARIRSFITTGDLDQNDKFISTTTQALPDLVGSLVWQPTMVSSIALLPPPPIVSYLLVAGGGSGGPSQAGQGGGGGGGAGGLLYGTTTITPGVIYEFTIGQGGVAAQPTSANAGNDGGNSTGFGLTVIGGGGGGCGDDGANSSGRTGGSGGGGGYRGYTTQPNGGAGTAGQGVAGSGVGETSAAGAGGGGAGGPGQTNTGTGAGQGGLGGAGETWLDGNTYAAGGQGAPVSLGSYQICGTADEDGTVSMVAPAGTTFTSVEFASYGTPDGTCGAFTLGGCHESNSLSIVQGYLIGQSGTINIPATNGVFGDPCGGTQKRLYIQATATGPGDGVQTDAPANTGNGGSGSYAQAPTYAGASGVGILRYSSVYADAALVTGDYVYSNTGGFKTYKFNGAGTIAFISSVDTVFAGTKIFSGTGDFEWTPPPGVTSVTVTFPTTTGLVTTTISCTPLVPINVSLGAYGSSSTFGSVTAPAYTKTVFNHSAGNMDDILRQTFTVATTAVTSASTTLTTNGPSATNLNVNGIFFQTTQETNQGDFQETVQISTVPISTLVGVFRTRGEIIISTGASSCTIEQQPSAANNWRTSFLVTEGNYSNTLVTFIIIAEQQGYFSITF